MKSMFGMVLCFGIAIAGAVSIAWELFGMPHPSMFAIQWAPLFESLPVVLVSVCIFGIIFALIRNSNSRETLSSFVGSNRGGLDKGPDLPAANLDSRSAQPVDEFDFDDYSENDSARTGGKQTGIDFRSDGYTEDVEIPELTEARVLLTFDRVKEAIELLKEAFDSKNTNYDVVAMELVSILENEIEDGEVSDSRRSELKIVRDDFVTQLAREKEKLSDDVWHYVHMEYPEITADHIEHGENDPEGNFGTIKIAEI